MKKVRGWRPWLSRFAPFFAGILGASLSLFAQAAGPHPSLRNPMPAVSDTEITRQDAVKPSDSSDPSLAEAQSLLSQGRVYEADRAVRHFLAQHRDSAEAHFLLGHILFREIQAEARLESQRETQAHGSIDGVKILPTNSLVTRSREEKVKASLAEFTAGAKYRDPSASDLKTVAFDYVLLAAYSDADKWLTKMLEWTPDDSEGWYYLGRTKYNENRFEEAVSAFQKCLKLDPRNVKAEDNLGLSYAGLGRNDEALFAYQQAIAWQAQAVVKNSGPYTDLASLLIEQDRPQEAVTYLLQAIEIAPSESRAHELLGKAYTRLGQFPKAQAELERAIDLSPHSPHLHCMLAPVYRKQGLAEKAKVEYEHCAALNGSHSVQETPRP